MNKGTKIALWFVVIIAVVIGGFFFLKSKPSVVGENSPTKTDMTETVLLDETGYNFTFEYPKSFASSSEDIEGGGKVITVESTEPKKGFQITTVPFDESEVLTPERIKQDLPDLVMDNVKNIEVDGFSALSFNSNDENLGDTFEVWFNAGGSLYQIQTYKEFNTELLEILKTWKVK